MNRRIPYGRAQWYQRYSLHIAKVEHSHGFEREVPGEDGAQAGPQG
ncbi:hypothetical protein [Streptomyces aurantiogriseus]